MAASKFGFSLGTSHFVRVLAVCHLIAFFSAWRQIDGLVGPHGILPAGPFFSATKELNGPIAYWYLPSLCWVFGTGVFLKILCLLGGVVSALLFVGIAPLFCLGFLWIGYLSICVAGQRFYEFQWDGLLLEATAVALFVVPWRLYPGWRRFEPPVVGRALLGWLLFRLMFFSGLVKLASGDPEWRSLHALAYHFQTQPLPTPLAWYAHQLPPWVTSAFCLLVFAVELLCPFGLVASRRLRHGCVIALVALQGAIAVTGNYTFFNLLSVGLCLPFLDDGFWRQSGTGEAILCRWAELHRGATLGLGSLFAGISAVMVFATVSPAVAYAKPTIAIESAVGPLRTFNTYGLFAVMTTTRPELVVEGSEDGREWKEYVLPHKPGPLRRRPDYIAPLQPRLDWQLWFAALDRPENNRWVVDLGLRLLQADPTVLRLFSENPFPSSPPKYLRVVRYEYAFTDAARRKNTGEWWRRTPVDVYLAPFSLRP